jgi:hypothetical protein
MHWRSVAMSWALIDSQDGKVSRYLARLGKAARFRLGLSGTPMPHSPLDVYGYFRFIDKTIFGWCFHKFRQHYAVMGGYAHATEVVQMSEVVSLGVLVSVPC